MLNIYSLQLMVKKSGKFPKSMGINTLEISEVIYQPQLVQEFFHQLSIHAGKVSSADQVGEL